MAASAVWMVNLAHWIQNCWRLKNVRRQCSPNLKICLISLRNLSDFIAQYTAISRAYFSSISIRLKRFFIISYREFREAELDY